jgi:glycerol-3-phosphate cytidylyltransferase
MLKWLNGDVSDKGRIGITFGAFDLLHAGHVAMLAEAKQNCDYLIVGLQNDPSVDRSEKNKPIQSIFERQLQITACRFVDEVVVYNTEADVLDILKTLPIHVRIIGSDYLDKDFTGKQYCIDNSIEVLYNSRSHSFSTSELRDRVKKA